MEDRAASASEASVRRAALDEVVINELARGRTYQEAATAAGWSGRTVARRMQDTSFRARVSNLRASWISELTGRLIDSGSEAIEAIREECRASERAADRLRAAGMLLTLGLRFRQTHELEERLRQVEVHLGLTEPAGEPGGSGRP